LRVSPFGSAPLFTVTGWMTAASACPCPMYRPSAPYPRHCCSCRPFAHPFVDSTTTAAATDATAAISRATLTASTLAFRSLASRAPQRLSSRADETAWPPSCPAAVHASSSGTRREQQTGQPHSSTAPVPSSSPTTTPPTTPNPPATTNASPAASGKRAPSSASKSSPTSSSAPTAGNPSRAGGPSSTAAAPQSSSTTTPRRRRSLAPRDANYPPRVRRQAGGAIAGDIRTFAGSAEGSTARGVIESAVTESDGEPLPKFPPTR
jgi:hypothetical protein